MRGYAITHGARTMPTIAALAAALLAGACARSSGGGGQAPAEDSIPHVRAASAVEAGRYLTIVGGCNDCHTPNWAETDGKVPPEQRLTGNPVGFRGPWGTSYPANLRAVVQRVSEDRWVQILTTADGGEGRPPMPWMNTRQMSEADLRALYRYIHGLGPGGGAIPPAVPPNQEPTTPYIWMVPRPQG